MFGERTAEKEIFEGCGKLSLIGLLTIILSPLYYLINGFVLSKLWLWFIVGTFGLQPLPLLHAIGLGMIVTFLTHQRINTPIDNKKQNWEKIFNETLIEYLTPFVKLGIGYLVYVLM